MDNEFCEPAKKAKQKSSVQPAITNKSKTAEVDKLPDVLLQLLRYAHTHTLSAVLFNTTMERTPSVIFLNQELGVYV